MNKLMISLAAVLSFTTIGCKKKGGGNDALAKMEGFSKSMCDCKDKACADKVNADMTAWGTEMAKTAAKDDKPDPELAKKSADIMTKYTECMTKLMTGGDAAKPADPKTEAKTDTPAATGGGKCPDGFTLNAESQFCMKVPTGAKMLHDGKGEIVGDNKAHEYSWVGGDKGFDYSIIVNVSKMSEYYDDSVADVKVPTYQGKALADGKIGDKGAWGSGEDGPPPAGFVQRHYIKSANRNDTMKLTCKITRASGPGSPSEDEVFEACKSIQFAQ